MRGFGASALVWQLPLQRIDLQEGVCYGAAWVSWPGIISIVDLVIAAIALVTGLVGWCPAYAVFGISTTKKVAT